MKGRQEGEQREVEKDEGGKEREGEREREGEGVRDVVR